MSVSLYIITSPYVPRGLLYPPPHVQFLKWRRLEEFEYICWYFLAISQKSVVIPSPKIALNLLRTHEKLHCKGERCRVSAAVSGTDTHTDKDPYNLS